MFCPQCRKSYAWYETRCPECDVDLVDQRPGPAPDPGAVLVPVFSTDDPGLLAVAEQALREAGIEAVLGAGGRFNPLEPLHPTVGLGALHGASDIVVREADVPRARAVLADLQGSESIEVIPADPIPVVEPPDVRDVELTDAATGAPIGRITEAQLRDLVDLLEEDFADSQSYYIDLSTIEMLEGKRVEAALTQMLRSVLGPRDSMDVQWSRRMPSDPA